MTHEPHNDTTTLSERLPKVGDQPFVRTNWLRGAYVAPNTDERLYRLIRGFWKSGDLLVEQSIGDAHIQQNLIYPILFNYRQSLELHLKYLVMAYGPHVAEAPAFRTHDLKTLWVKCRTILETLNSEMGDSDRAMIEAAEAYIVRFSGADPGSDAFRFAHDTKGQPMKLELQHIDLAHLREVMTGLHNLLECIDLQLRYGYGVPRCDY